MHNSVNFGKKLQASCQGSVKNKNLNPLGTGRQWSKVEQDIVSTLNDFTKEYVRQIDLHFKTFNRYLVKENIDISVKQNPDKIKQYHTFLAQEEQTFWKDFPRNKKFYHAYLRKIYTLFNQCKMPESLNDANSLKLQNQGSEEHKKKQD